jgi:hypothetical protein
VIGAVEQLGACAAIERLRACLGAGGRRVDRGDARVDGGRRGRAGVGVLDAVEALVTVQNLLS